MIIFRPSCGLSSAVGCEGAPHFNAFIRSDFVCSEGDTIWYFIRSLCGFYRLLVEFIRRPSTTVHSSRRKLVQISFARVLAALPSCSVWGVIWLFSKGQSYRYTCNPYGLPWSGPASVCASALPAACRALLLWPFRGSFRGFWPASGIFARLPAFAPFLRPFLAFLRCLSQYVPPPAALRLLCLPLLPALPS